MMRRYTVAEAADTLGISQAAVRARIHRGTLQTEREDGTVYVWFDDEHYVEQHANNVPGVVEVLREQNGDLREQIEFLRDELRRKDTIIMAMTQRIPELEPAQEEHPEAPASPGPTVTPPDAGGEPHTATQRPWWLRWLT